MTLTDIVSIAAEEIYYVLENTIPTGKIQTLKIFVVFIDKF